MLGSVGFAYAEAPKPLNEQLDRRGALVKGEVTAIAGDTLTVQTEQRGTLTVQITGRTRFRAPDDANFTLADIKVGDTLAVRGRFVDDKTLVAQVVQFLPAEVADDVRGRVTAVNGSTITVEDKDGNATDIVTSADTRFRVQGQPDASIDDVKVGMLLGAAGQFDANGDLVARHVIVRDMPERKFKGGPIAGGEVAEVNGGEFVLKYLDGSSLTVTTDASTLVITRGENGPALGSLSDVTEGARIVAMGIPSGDSGSIAARVILIGQANPANEPLP
jgi:hypothetical protein